MIKKPGKDRLVPWFLVLAGAILFLPFLGSVHLFDWDEINFAECAREMLVTKKYFLVTVDYVPFWEKPPLFIWMQALSMKMFGVGEYAARLPDAICGIATLLMLYRIGTLWKDKRFGLLWVLAYVGSILPHLYFKSGIIDPWFNFFIFTGMYFFTRYSMNRKNIMPGNNIKLLALSALCIGLGVMTKGPVAFLVFFLSILVYWVLNRGKAIISVGHASFFILLLGASGGAWFLAEILTGHWDTVIDFIKYQVRLFQTPDAGHGGPFYFHVVILLFGCFPASIFAIRGMLIKNNDAKFNEASRWMAILFWVVLILFSVVKTKIIHYSSLCYYPLTFFAAYAVYKMIYEGNGWKKWMGWGIGIIGGLLAILLISLPIVGIYRQFIINSGIIKDSFTNANLEANVDWSYADCIIGLILLASVTCCLVMVKKKKIKIAVLGLFFGTLLTTSSALLFIVPKIEQHTQGAAIDFYKGLAGKDVYITTMGYKSFAEYYYAQIPPWTNKQCLDDDWLFSGNIDKPVYIVCRVNYLDELQKQRPTARVLYQKNGFVFLERVNSPGPR